MTDVTIQKQQLQSTNNWQTKLHTMFEDMVQDLEGTRKTLDLTANCLSDSQAALSASNGELATVKKKLKATAKELASAEAIRGRYYDWYVDELQERKRTGSVVTTLKEEIEQLESELAHEKEKVKINADSEKQLKQLKKQWSTLSNVLGDN